MKASLENLCGQFIEARDVIRDTFKWDSGYLPPVCANLFCAAGAVPDMDRLRACRDLINRKTGFFSSFRGYIRVPLACLLSMENQPEKKFDSARAVYQMLREQFSGSDYLALAAFLLTEYDCTEERVARGKRIYRLMKDEHPFLTSSEDSIFALMMAWSDQSDEDLISGMEDCYRVLVGPVGRGPDLRHGRLLPGAEGTLPRQQLCADRDPYPGHGERGRERKM